ncbi:MAG: response regulator [Pseudomonadota bacterium]
MFTSLELQIIGKTLLSRRDWLNKSINNPEMNAVKVQNQEALELIDSVLVKIGFKPKPAQLTKETTSTAASSSKMPKLTKAQKRSQLSPEKMKVLVVDDEILITEFLAAMLNSAGIVKVDAVTDGLQAINALYAANPPYDLVLCDWSMPIKTGLDVHNAMRAAERYLDTCFMLVTAVTEAAQIRAAIELGVDDYIVKPIEEEKIIKKVARHFPNLATSSLTTATPDSSDLATPKEDLAE